MNKKAIWIIIGLMSAALIGIVVLQTYWINWAIQLEGNRFDKNIFVALNKVSVKLEHLENIEANLDIISQVDNDKAAVWQKRFYQQIETGGDIMSIQTGLQEVYLQDSSIHSSGSAHLNNDNDCDCEKCRKEKLLRYERQSSILEQKMMTKLFSPVPIVERIKLKFLNKIIKEELGNVGVNIEFKYGVFSKNEKSFVITNNHYVVEDTRPNFVPTGWKNLYNSKYQVALFPNDLESPGFLMVHFPTKASIVLESIWKTLLAAVIFTGIILFCFAYTIQVVFRQKKLSEMKTDFINNMTHEFKTPIATISLAADSITSPMLQGKPDKVRRFAEIIKEENRRMNRQVEKVLQMAVIDKRDFALNLIDVNLHEVINQAAQIISLQVEKKGGTVKVDLQATNPTIQGDLTHISNIIYNLTDNANKYSPGKPEITISAKNVRNGVEVSVKDKGMGMTKEAKKLIFDKFYRVHTGNLHNIKGFGLGLSYVKTIINAHNGQIKVESELGKGSTFILFFPFKLEEE